MKSVFLLTFFIASASYADVEDYQIESCTSNEAYESFNVLQIGDEIQFTVSNDTIFAPEGHQVQNSNNGQDPSGTPYISTNPSYPDNRSQLTLFNNTGKLLKMTKGKSHTLTVVAYDEIAQSTTVQSRGGYSFTLSCKDIGKATTTMIPCTTENLLTQFEGLRVIRGGHQLSQLQIPEPQECESRFMEIEEASLQPTAL